MNNRSLATLLAGVALLAGCQQPPDKADGPAAPETQAPAAAPETAAPTESAAPVAAPSAAATPAAVEKEAPKPEPAPKAAVKAEPVASAAPTQVPAPAPAPQAVAIARPASFAKCAICHMDKPGQKSGFGPNLFGVAGTRSGELPGYAFSPAMKSAGIVWTRENLDRFIEAPQTVVPGTRMAFAGVKDAGERQVLIDYLLKLK